MASQGYGSDYYKARDERKKAATAEAKKKYRPESSSSTPKADENARVSSMLNELNDCEEGLSEWEMNFVDDLMDRQATQFSEKQMQIIERIWDERIGKTR